MNSIDILFSLALLRDEAQLDLDDYHLYLEAYSNPNGSPNSLTTPISSKTKFPTPYPLSSLESNNPKKLKERVTEFVVKNRQKDALTLLRNHFETLENDEEKKICIVLLSSFSQYRRNKIGKLLNEELLSLEKRKIDHAILELLDLLVD